MTTNSCASLPVFFTSNSTLPGCSAVVLGLIAKSWRVTASFSSDALDALDAAGDALDVAFDGVDEPQPATASAAIGPIMRSRFMPGDPSGRSSNRSKP